VYTIDRASPSADRIREAAAVLRSAKRPLLIAGGGVQYSDACDALQRFAEATGIPVAVTQAGKGSLLESHELALGGIGVTGTACANRLALEADVVLVVGTRLSDFTTASKTQFRNPDVRFIAINVHGADAAKHGALPLVGDARATLQALTRAVRDWRVPAGHTRAIREAREAWKKPYTEMTAPKKPSPEGLLYQSEVIRLLNEFTDENSVMLHAAGSIPGDVHKLWNCKSSTDYHAEYGYSCMGYEIAGAVGVKLAAPEREVYAFLGDGSYLMMNHELVTAVQEGLKITIVLTDNQGYGCIHNLQRSCGGRSFGNEFRHRSAKSRRLDAEYVSVDYVANARSLGATVFTANDAASLRVALQAAKDESNSCLIYVPVSRESIMQGFSWWDVPPAEISSVPSVQRARKAYTKGVAERRYYY
jgi:3D-(3,5/4)-trihydroxycyclohexane-1,2-dione acylhydrolase (decyclizing)